MNKIYLDHASTSPILPEVADKMHKIMMEDFGNPSSIHHYGRKARAIVEDARKVVANYIKSSIGEIFFTSSATEANNTIIKNCVFHLGVKRIISSPTEHHCVLHTLDYLEQNHNVEVIYLDVDKNGNINLDQLKTLLQNDIKTLVSLMYGNNEIGTINPIKEVSELCKETNTLFHCDAVQAMTKIDINVGETYFSFLTASAHKFNGPKGVGFFYMNGDNIIPPFIHGGAQERNMRAGTENTYGIVGLATAIEYHKEHREAHINTILELRDYFINRLTSELDDVYINGNTEDNFLPHVISVSFPATDRADMLMFNLDISGISASSGSACSSGIEKDSHVLVAIGHPTERKTIRFSISYMTTKEEIDYCMDKLKKITPVK